MWEGEEGQCQSQELWKQTDLSPLPHILAMSLCPHSEGKSHLTAAVKIMLGNKCKTQGTNSVTVFHWRQSSG